MIKWYLLIFIAATSFASTDSQSVCSTIGTSSEIRTAQKNALSKAQEIFLNGLEPQYRKIIHRQEDIGINDHISMKNKLVLYAQYETALYEAVSAWPTNSAHPVSPASVEKRFSEIANLLIAEVQKDKNFSEAQKNLIQDKLSNVLVVTLNSLSQEPESERKSLERVAFFSLCDTDLSSANAAAVQIPDSKNMWAASAFIVCPGLAVVSAPLLDKEQGMDFTLAHELSHLITKSLNRSNTQPLGLDDTLLAAQNDYLSCMQSRFGEDLRTLSQMEKILRPYYERAKKDPFALLHSRESETLIDDDNLLNHFEKYYGKEPTSVDSHSSELLADRWATRVVTKLIDHNAENYLAPFCEELGTYQNAPEDGDEGIHPSNRFRIENFLENRCD
jgi:hypothetical protein